MSHLIIEDSLYDVIMFLLSPSPPNSPVQQYSVLTDSVVSQSPHSLHLLIFSLLSRKS